MFHLRKHCMWRVLPVIWIKDNAQERPIVRSLFENASDSLIESLSLQNGISYSISTFLVETNRVKVLFDTGYGYSDSQLLDGLQKLHIASSEIKYLYLTHFHRDHISGLLRNDSVVFPNAGVYTSRKEYEAWINTSPDKNIQQVKTINAYKKHLHLFEFSDTLLGNIKTIDTSGYTPGHTAYQIEK